MVQIISDSEITLLEQQALIAAQRIFPCEENLIDSMPMTDIIKALQTSVCPQQHPFLVRVAGQSGTGKSTQLVPALEQLLAGIPYTKINVGLFAPFHPRYLEWQKQNPNLLREKTNGFALRALILFYCHCIQQRTNILLDMTLLEPEIEHYLMGIAKKYGYRIQLHVMCVPKKVSDFFVRQRYIMTGRYVSQKSTLYFFNILANSLKSLINRLFFDKTDELWLWSHYHARPLKKTSFFNPYVTTILMKQQQNRRIKKASVMLKAKKTWLFLLRGKV